MSQKSNHGKPLDPFERALRQTVRRSLGAPGAACPQPEVLAAYFERSLSSAESAEWEKHFSLCSRCQQQLAALARSEPRAVWYRREPIPEKRSVGWAWLRSPHLIIRWLAPAVVALGSVALWIAIRPTPSNLDQIARESSKPVAAVQTSPAPEKAKAAPAVSIAPQASRVPYGIAANQPSASKPAETPMKKLPAKRPEPVQRDELAKLPAEKGRADLETPPSALRSQTSKNEAAPSAVAPAIPAPLKEQGAVVAAVEQKQAQARDVVTRQEQEGKQAQQLQQAPPPSGAGRAAPSAAGAVGGVRAAAGEQKSQAPKLEGALADRPLEKQEVPAFASKAVERLSTPVGVLIPAPGASVIWRIGTEGRIQRSLDGGRTWEPQASGVQTDLTNGQAASATVCWLVGKKGTVLRTTDGLHWQKIPFPLEADLSKVAASDARHAVVTTAEGQAYGTENGGQSWQRR